MTNVPAVPTVFPPQNTPLTDKNGAATNAGMAFFRDLYNRTGAGTGIFNSVGEVDGSVTPSPLNFDINVFSITNTVTVCILYNMQPGQSQMVVNQMISGVLVDPPAGGTIDGGASYNLPGGKSQIFTCLETQGDITSLQLG